MHAAQRIAALVAVALLGLLPWLVWPTHEEPFSAPKRLALAVAAGLVWAVARLAGPSAAGATPRLFALVCGGWIASYAVSALVSAQASVSALVLGVAGPAWALALLRARPPASHVTAAMLASATGIALLALLQWAGADPFPAAGWTPEIAGGSQRLRVYATLGNPNFVAAWVAMHLPLAAALARASDTRLARLAGVGSLAVLLAAIAATGSRGGALGAAAGLLTWALLARAVRPTRALAAAALLVALLAWVSPARVLPETAAGRFYILMVAWPHALERPVAGLGPGTFELHYPAWEQAGRRERRLPPTLVHRFAGPQQHAHNDYLQALVERGAPGLVTFLLALTTPLLIGARSSRAASRGGVTSRGRPAALAGVVVAVAACALVDFPFQRPAETLTFWTAAALLAAGRQTVEEPVP